MSESTNQFLEFVKVGNENVQLRAENKRLRDALKEAVRIANATMTCCYAGSEDPYPLNEELKRLEQDQADWGRE